MAFQIRTRLYRSYPRFTRVCPQEGEFSPFLYLHRVPRDMRVVSPPVLLLQFYARTPAQRKWCKYYSYHNIYARIDIFKTSKVRFIEIRIVEAKKYLVSVKIREVQCDLFRFDPRLRKCHPISMCLFQETFQ